MSAHVEQTINARLTECEADRRLLCLRDHSMNKAVRERLSGDEIIRAAPGMFVRKAIWDDLKPDARHLWLARTMTGMDSHLKFCNVTAAVVRGLSVSYDLLDRINLVSSPRGYGVSSDLIHRHRMGGDLWQTVDGLTVTSLERTTFDCLRTTTFRDGLAIADSALRAGLAKSFLLELLGSMHHYRGLRQARITASYADAAAESGGESVARAAMIELGFAIPQLQATFTDPIDGRQRRVDFLWVRPDGSHVIGELDGRAKYVDPSMTGGRSVVDVLADERLRESHLSLAADGAPIVRFSVGDTYNRAYFERLLTTFGVPRAS
jgi:hypothetical protein